TQVELARGGVGEVHSRAVPQRPVDREPPRAGRFLEGEEPGVGRLELVGAGVVASAEVAQDSGCGGEVADEVGVVAPQRAIEVEGAGDLRREDTREGGRA